MRRTSLLFVGAEVVDLHWHDLRHTFATRLVMAGVDIRTLQHLMGHQLITMTMRCAHLSPEHQLKAVQRLTARAKEREAAQG